MSKDAVEILVVDDNESLLELSVRALTKASFRVRGVSDFAALEEALADAPGLRLILMDVNMPELFGDDVAHTLRHVRGIRAQIYLYSSLDEAELQKLATAANLDGAISKNAGVQHVIDTARRILTGP